MKIIILHPDSQREERELPADSDKRLEALQAAVGGYIEYLSPAFHGLHNHEVIINEEGLGRLPLNTTGSLESPDVPPALRTYRVDADRR